MTDKKAHKILFDTYWDGGGWRREPTVSGEDFAYACEAGLMFPAAELSHAEVVGRVGAAWRALSREWVSNAFLVSLGSRQLEYRSALGSYAIGRNFVEHDFEGQGRYCSICGMIENPARPYDLSEFNFERYKWGGVQHELPAFMAFDLEQFASLARVEASEQDVAVMRQIIEVVRRCRADAKARELEKSLAAVIKSNQAEREVLVQVLAYCGILQPAARASYFTTFVKYSERRYPAANRLDWSYPACWWRGADGVNQQALDDYFPQLSGG